MLKIIRYVYEYAFCKAGKVYVLEKKCLRKYCVFMPKYHFWAYVASELSRKIHNVPPAGHFLQLNHSLQ